MLRQIIVNGEAIDPQLISDAFYRLKALAEMSTELSCCDRDAEFMCEAEKEVIDGILLAQEAERRVPTIDETQWRPAFEQVLREWRQHGASWELIDHQRNELRQETLAKLRMDAFTADLFAPITSPSEAELRDFYQHHLEEFWQPHEAEFLHLMRLPASGKEMEDYRLLKQIRSEAMEHPSRFADLAQQHTQKNQQHIELGWIRQERWRHPFESIIFSLKPLEISPILFHDDAFHLIQALQCRGGELQEFDDLRHELAERWRIQQQQGMLRDLTATLRENAVIEMIDNEA